ncbi:hypothetical protein HYU89_00305 [Candidatus Collierbacteria bacterium]|nr:hypothetical protein [Candidatus Collierbacteria bacterium]
MSAEDQLNVPPIVQEIAGDDPTRLGIVVHAYQSLWDMTVCGRNGELRTGFIQWLNNPNHSWLEAEPMIGERTPLARLRVSIEREKQNLLAKGLNPCPDFSLN